MTIRLSEAMRVESVASEITTLLKESTDAQRRAASLAACAIALKSTSIDIAVVDKAISALRSGRSMTTDMVAELESVANELDEKYFELQDEDGDEGEVLRFFGQARAVSALACAGKQDSLMASMESIYEASAAVDEASIFFDAVRSVLDKNSV